MNGESAASAARAVTPNEEGGDEGLPMELRNFEAEFLNSKGIIRMATAKLPPKNPPPGVGEEEEQHPPPPPNVMKFQLATAPKSPSKSSETMSELPPGMTVMKFPLATAPQSPTKSGAETSSEQLGNLDADAMAKQRGRGDGSVSRPGAVPSGGVDSNGNATLTQLERDIAAKSSGGPSQAELERLQADTLAKQQGRGSGPATTPGYSRMPPRNLESLESDIVAKQQGRNSNGPAIRPGVVAGGIGGAVALSQLEQDVAVKQAGRPMHSSMAPGAVSSMGGGSQLSRMEQDAVTKQARRSMPPAMGPGAVSSGGGVQLSQLERDIAAKHSRRPVSSTAAPSHLSRLEQDIAAKQGRYLGQGAVANSQLSQLEQDIAAKSSASGRSDRRSTGLDDLEDEIDEKARMRGVGIVAGTGAVGLGMAALAANRNEQNDFVAKHDSGMVMTKPQNLKGAGPEQAPSKLQEPMGGPVGGGLDPDVEYGMYDPANEGLAVAMPVPEDEDDPYIQSAVEYDPDAKPPVFKKRQYRLYAFLAFFGVVAGAVGAVVGIVLSHNSSNGDTGLPYRETLGIKDRVERLVGTEEISNPDSPYTKALEWITHNDTMALLPEAPNFVQRYVLAYFYFATTENGPWFSCNPPEPEVPDACIYQRLTSVEPRGYLDIPWTRWLTKRDECLWAGVVCDDSKQVRSIELVGQELSGPFPEGIKYFPLLQSLTMMFGSLYGPVPAEIADMKHLVNMELHYNAFTGPIPDEWFGARNWVRLNLGSNKFTGTISPSIANLTDMRALYLQDNLLEGEIPTEVGLLRSLAYLYAHKNGLTGSIPTEILGATNLEALWLHKNRLSGELPADIGKLKFLDEIRLYGNSQLGGMLPDSFYDLNSVWRMDLRDCNFTGPLSPRIGEFSALQELRISNNNFNGPLPSSISGLKQLRDVQLEGNKFTGEISQEMCALVGPIGIQSLQADCKDESGSVSSLAPVQCSCCTLCCNPDGENCS